MCVHLFFHHLCGDPYPARTGQTASYATGDDGDLKAGVAWPAQRFTSGTGSEVDCITDNLTGLMWSKAGLASANWGSALSTINASSLCGHDDWRMPNVNELESLVHAGETNTAAWLNSQGFTSLAGAFYWTSTTRLDLLNQAFVINLGSPAPMSFFYQKDNNSQRFRSGEPRQEPHRCGKPVKHSVMTRQGLLLPALAQARTATSRPALLGL